MNTLEKALSLLSGDFSYDQVAETKELIKLAINKERQLVAGYEDLLDFRDKKIADMTPTPIKEPRTNIMRPLSYEQKLAVLKAALHSSEKSLEYHAAKMINKENEILVEYFYFNRFTINGYQISLGRKAVAQRGFDRFLVQNLALDCTTNSGLFL